MSFSFAVKGSTKDDAADKVFTELTKVCEQQSIHAADSQQVNEAAKAFIGILPDDETQDVSVTVSGSVSWKGDVDKAPVLTGVSVNINVSHVAKS